MAKSTLDGFPKLRVPVEVNPLHRLGIQPHPHHEVYLVIYAIDLMVTRYRESFREGELISLDDLAHLDVSGFGRNFMRRGLDDLVEFGFLEKPTIDFYRITKKLWRRYYNCSNNPFRN